MKHHLLEIVNSVKVGIVTGVTTTSIGISTIEGVPDEYKLFSWIPEDIGRLAALLGIILTSVIIAVQVNNWRKSQLEIKKLKTTTKEKPPHEG